MKELIAVVLALASYLSYFLVGTRLPFYQRWPVVHILLGLVACFWLVRLLMRAKSPGRRIYGGAALLFALALTGLFLWYNLDYSNYPSTESAVAVGEQVGGGLAEMRLASHTGEATPVLEPGYQGTLLVFYRGFW